LEWPGGQALNCKSMVLLPIVGRELRVATLRRRTYWTRTVAAGLAVQAGVLMLSEVQNWQAAASVGRALFNLLSTLAFGLWLLAAVDLAGLVPARVVGKEEAVAKASGHQFLDQREQLVILAGGSANGINFDINAARRQLLVIVHIRL